MVQYRNLDRTLAALADPTRRAILERLGGGPATITELAAPFEISLTGARKHVAVLEAAGLVSSEKLGRARHCVLAPGALEEVEDWIVTYRKTLEARLDRLGELLENSKGDPR